MLNLRVGTAPDSWGVWMANDPKQPPWEQFLDEVVLAGYEWIEIGPFGYLPTDAPILLGELDRRGLKAVAGLVGADIHKPGVWPTLKKDLLDTGSLLAACNAKFLSLAGGSYLDAKTGIPGSVTAADNDEWDRMIENTHRAAELTRVEFGIMLLFHPHAYGFIETESQINRFLSLTDAGSIGICLDTGHYGYRGGDPVRLMRRYHSRIPHLHIKNFDEEIREKVQSEGVPHSSAVQLGAFCELAHGGVDFVSLLAVLRDIEYSGWVIVEQDMYPAPFDKPFPIAKRNRHFMSEVGYG